MRVVMICPEVPTDDRPGSMAPTARQFASLRELGIEIDIVDMRGIPKLKYLQVIPRVRRLARQADLIHAHFGYCGWLAQLAPRKPIVMSFMGHDLLGSPKANGDLEWFSRVMVRWNCSLATKVDAVIVKSQEMAKVIAPAESTVIPNGVDIEKFKPMDVAVARRTLGWDDTRKKILFPGDPENPRKGFALATAAVQCAEKATGEPIDLMPLWNVPPDDVATYMNACEVMLMTSLIEGSPNVVKEAMACDLPVIGVPVGDVHEMIGGVRGYTACQRDAEEIGQALSWMLTTEAAVEGRQAIIERGLDLESVARRVIRVYERVLGKSVASRAKEAPITCAQGSLQEV